MNNYCVNEEHIILDFNHEVELKRRGEKQLERFGDIQNLA